MTSVTAFRTLFLLATMCSFMQPSRALYNGESFIYKGKQLVMPSSFNVSFIQKYTIPISLQLNTMCQVSSFQLEQFNNATKSKYIVAGRKRGTDKTCDTVQYCDNGGLANQNTLCTGVQTHLVTYDCIKSVWNASQQLLEQASSSILSSAAGFTEAAVDDSIKGINRTLQDQLSALNAALTSSLTSQEATLVGAIARSSSVVTSSLQKTIANLAQSTSDKVAEVVRDTNSALNSLSVQVAQQVSDVTSKLLDVEMTLDGRITKLVSEMNTVIDNMNLGSVDVQNSLESISAALVQLASQQEINSRLLEQGVDISNLLMNWNAVANEQVFQDPSSNYYTYVSEGMIGVYDKSQDDIDYPSNLDVSGRYAYACYEESDSDPIMDVSDSQVLLNLTYEIQRVPGPYLPETDIRGQNLYDYVSKVLGSYKSVDQCKSWVNSLLRRNTDSLYVGAARAKNYFLVISEIVSEGEISDEAYGRPYYVIVDEVRDSPVCVLVYHSAPTTNITLSNLKMLYRNATKQDSGRYVTIVKDKLDPVLESVTPDAYDFSYNLETLEDVFKRTTVPKFPDSSQGAYWHGSQGAYLGNAPSYYQPINRKYINERKVITSGNNHFVVDHPTMGKMKIHRCSRLGTGANSRYINSYPDDPSSSARAFGITDGNGQIMAGSYNGITPGLRNVPSYGKVGSSTNIIVRSTDNAGAPIPGSEPDAYYYTADIWCCSETMVPVHTVNNTEHCAKLNMQICNSARFGYCAKSVGSETKLRKLTQVINTYACPSGYVQQPSSIVMMYKSPRIYYCSGKYKFASPYGIELQFCAKATAKLPGAGVLIQSNVMAPGGLYPADCIFWNNVQGKIPVYSIDVDIKDQTVPTAITNLRGQKIAYYTSGSIVIDEMDRLYGPQNSGYDCVTYEMDKILHDPRNCINYNIPTYDVSAYFTGKVRSSGVSKLLDYFDITPVYLGNQLIMNFALKDGIDYEAAYIRSVNHCPLLNVEYLRGPPRCSLSGWPTSAVAGIQIVIGSSEVCNGGSCTGNVIVQDNVEINITVISTVNSQDSTTCSRFKCLASSNVFVAYPVETFTASIQRPNVERFVDSYNDTELVKRFNEQVLGVRSSIDSMYANLTTAMNRIVVNATIGYDVEKADITPVYKYINDSYSKTIANLQNDLDQISKSISGNLELTMATVNSTIKQRLDKAMADVNSVISNFSAPLDNVTKIYQNTTLMQNSIKNLQSALDDMNITLQNIRKGSGSSGISSSSGGSANLGGNDFSGNQLSPSAKIADPLSTSLASAGLLMAAISLIIHMYNCCSAKKGLPVTSSF